MPVTMSTELKILLGSHKVRDEIQKILTTDDVMCETVSQFACIVTKEEDLVPEILDEAGLDKVKIGDKTAMRCAWHAARATMNGGSEKSSAGAASSSKMPDGAENQLRTAFKAVHNFNVSGAWLVNEDLMAKLYKGLMSAPKFLFVPDVASIGLRSSLSQKPMKGTLITDHGVEHMDFTLNPCTTHPDIYLRIRAYIMTICWLSCLTPEWFTYETALDVTDFVFESINLRADGKRPSLECITQCFLSMWSEFAKRLQNEKVVLEGWIREKSNWQHFWKESIVSFEQTQVSTALALPSSASGALPADIGNMVQTNNSLIRTMQGSFERQFQSLTDRVNQPRGGKNGGGRGQKGNGQKGKNDAAGANAIGKGNKRRVSVGKGDFARRGKQGKRQ